MREEFEKYERDHTVDECLRRPDHDPTFSNLTENAYEMDGHGAAMKEK